MTRLSIGLGALCSIGALSLAADAAVMFNRDGIGLQAEYAPMYQYWDSGSGSWANGGSQFWADVQFLGQPDQGASRTVSARRLDSGGNPDVWRPSDAAFNAWHTHNPGVDFISGSISTSYTYGEDHFADALKFTMGPAHAGAVSTFSGPDSHGDDAESGNPGSAFIVASGAAFFRVDGRHGEASTPIGTRIGSLEFDALLPKPPGLLVTGRLEVDGTEVLSFSSASAFDGASYGLFVGSSYLLVLSYEAMAQDGTSMTWSGFDYTVAVVAAVPGPAGLSVLALAGLAVRRRRD